MIEPLKKMLLISIMGNVGSGFSTLGTKSKKSRPLFRNLSHKNRFI